MPFATFFRVPIGALALLLFLRPQTGHSQTTTAPGTPLDYVEQMPEYPGGNGAILQSLAQNVKYPKEALRYRIQGKVYVKFVVDETGHVVDPVVLRGIGSGCDAAAVRAVQGLARFTPGRQNGVPVKVYYNVPIAFTIRKMPPPSNWNPAYAGDEGVVYDLPEEPITHVGVAPAQEGGLYSQPAPQPGVRGAVIVRFLLDTEGRVQYARVDAPQLPSLDSAAIRLVAASSGWRPARQGGVVVPSHLSHTLLFGVERRPDVFYAPEAPATYLGDGPDALAKHLQQVVQYPAVARAAKRGGVVRVRIVVDTTGQVTEPESITSLSPELDAEALRAVQTLPAFRPARHAGKPVASYVIVPVVFRLEQK